MIATPVGELATLGVGKETTFNTFATPTTFHELEAFSPATKTSFIMRQGSVGAPGMRPPATGPLEVSGSLRIASVSDICSQLMAYAMGTQSAPVKYVIANTTLNASYTGGATTITVASGTGIGVGQIAVIVGDANTPAVTAVSGTTVTLAAGGFASSHASSTAINFTSPTAYSSALTFGNLKQLPSFSMEYNVPASGGFGECLDYTGCVVETLKASLASGKGLAMDYTFAGTSQVKQASPTAASFSTKSIYTMEAPSTTVVLNGVQIGGLTTPPDVKSWDLTLSNQLDKSRRSAGSGRLVNGYPLGQRKVTGSMKLGFESEVARQTFWGAATAPASNVAGVPLVFNLASADAADTLSNGYYVNFTMAAVRFSQADVPHKVSGALEQTVNFIATESAVGAGNDLVINLLNTMSTIW